MPDILLRELDNALYRRNLRKTIHSERVQAEDRNGNNNEHPSLELEVRSYVKFVNI